MQSQQTPKQTPKQTTKAAPDRLTRALRAHARSFAPEIDLSAAYAARLVSRLPHRPERRAQQLLMAGAEHLIPMIVPEVDRLAPAARLTGMSGAELGEAVARRLGVDEESYWPMLAHQSEFDLRPATVARDLCVMQASAALGLVRAGCPHCGSLSVSTPDTMVGAVLDNGLQVPWRSREQLRSPHAADLWDHDPWTWVDCAECSHAGWLISFLSHRPEE